MPTVNSWMTSLLATATYVIIHPERLSSATRAAAAEGIGANWREWPDELIKRNLSKFSLKAAAAAWRRQLCLKQSDFINFSIFWFQPSLGNSFESPDGFIASAKAALCSRVLQQERASSPSSKTDIAQSFILTHTPPTPPPFPFVCILRTFLLAAWLKLRGIWRLFPNTP